MSVFRMLVSLCFSALLLAVSPAMARGAPESFADMVEKLSPAVVNVSTTQKIRGMSGVPFVFPFEGLPPGQIDPFRDFFEHFGMPQGGGGGMPEQEVQSLGSGFVIDPAGYIVTNNHVIDGADEISVRFQDDTQYKAAVVGRDKKTDLALLKIEAKKPLPFVRFGDSDRVRVGDWVVAIGNPYGLGGSVTSGIISARSRHINAGPFDDFLQTDAAINRGNSGGPMFDLDGEVIGINTAIFSPTGANVGIGFAIPSAMVKPVIEQLKQFGRTHRGWLGVKIQDVTEEVADSVGLKRVQGALVLEVTPGSPAAKAGIQTGDVILSFNGTDIKEMRALPRIVAETKIGAAATVEVWRVEEKKTFSVTLGEMEEKDEEKTFAKDNGGKRAELPGEKLLGMRVAAVDDALRERFPIGKKVAGVMVLEVAQGSAAAARGITSGDVITGVGSQSVTTAEALRKAVATAKAGGKKFVLMRILRGKTVSFVPLPTGEEKTE